MVSFSLMWGILPFRFESAEKVQLKHAGNAIVAWGARRRLSHRGPGDFRSLKEVGVSAQEMPQQGFVAQGVSDAVGPRDLRVFPKIPDAAHKKPRVSPAVFLPGTRTFAVAPG